MSSINCVWCFLYCHPRPVRLYHICSHYLINGFNFWRKNLLDIKCVFWFSLKLLSETFLILRRIQRDIIISVCISSRNVLLFFLPYFNETGIFSTDFRKILKYKIYSKSVHWEQNFSVQTDGLEESSSRFSQFCEYTEIWCGEKKHFAWFQASAAK